MEKEIDVNEFFGERGKYCVIDARSPQEYEDGHIPGAFNIPLFDNEERKVIGTIYHREGSNQALMDGMKIAGTKLEGYVKSAKVHSDGRELLVHCWRGGMRSKSLAWLFEFSGLKTCCLTGGYKSYRKFIREEPGKETKIVILGGYTGSGKTNILRKLEEMGEQVVDIEKIAKHKGSVFGNVDSETQPCNEQFENNLFEQWHRLDKTKRIWIEDESIGVGNVFIPQPLFNRMNMADMIIIKKPAEERIANLIREYSGNSDFLVVSTLKLEKRLGIELCKKIVDSIKEGNLEYAAEKLIEYYDKNYEYSISRKSPASKTYVEITGDNTEAAARIILRKAEEIL